MSSDRLEELLWLRVDGALDEREREELHTLLAVHPDAERLEGEVDHLAERLDGLPRVAVPAELQERIHRALAAVRPHRPAETSHSVVRLRPAVTWRARLIPLAAGLVLGAAITQLLHLGPGRVADGARAAGTMHSMPVGRGGAPVEVDLGGDVGSLRLQAAGGTLVVELRLVANTAATLAVEDPDGDLYLVSAGHTGGAEGTVTTEAGRVVLQGTGTGSHRLSVAVANGAGRLRLVVATETGAVVERWVEVGPAGDAP